MDVHLSVFKTCYTLLYTSGPFMTLYNLLYISVVIVKNLVIQHSSSALCLILSFLPDKPHNPMVNAGAIVISSLIKVNRLTIESAHTANHYLSVKVHHTEHFTSC